MHEEEFKDEFALDGDLEAEESEVEEGEEEEEKVDGVSGDEDEML